MRKVKQILITYNDVDEDKPIIHDHNDKNKCHYTFFVYPHQMDHIISCIWLKVKELEK